MANDLTCSVCGASATSSALFCPRCTAPLTVVSLAELTDEDRRRCLAALSDVLAGALSRPQAGGDDAEAAELFSSYLSALWLRPETALIQYAEARGLQRIDLPEGPWLDLGCGDGIHAALYSGWRFGAGFDAFQGLDLSARDMFDHFDAAAFDAPVTRQGASVAWGVDIKASAIERSKALGVFERVERADATALPIEDGSIAVIFSNMLRDLGETLPAALGEVRRVLKPEGRVVLSAATPAYRRSLYFAPKAEAADGAGERGEAEQLLRLDRGRSVFCQQQLSPEDWSRVLADAGLELVATEPIVGPEAIRFWDVGFRPFAVPLIGQAQAWREQGMLGAVKPAAMAALEMMLAPIRARIAEGEPCMQLVVARKL